MVKPPRGSWPTSSMEQPLDFATTNPQVGDENPRYQEELRHKALAEATSAP
jgi:hypothetical protein